MLLVVEEEQGSGTEANRIQVSLTAEEWKNLSRAAKRSGTQVDQVLRDILKSATKYL